VRIFAALIVLAALATASCGSQSSPHRVVSNAGHPCHGTEVPSRYEHVVLVVLENHGYDQVAHSSPYLNALASECGLATNYRAVSHPSLPNYLALTSGTTAGIDSDCTDCTANVRSIFQQLGGDWRTYAESLPAAGFRGPSAHDYAKKHNPAAYYPAVATAYARDAAPLTPAALRSLGRFTLVVPNLCSDEHDCSVETGDRWLVRWIPRILHTSAYRSGNTALFVTYDEDTDSDNAVYTTVVAPSVRPGTVSAASFDHYSLLRTAEQLLGLPCLAHACAARSMAAAFHLGGS
jgi:phosphatidylinositol-3-phosphatase